MLHLGGLLSATQRIQARLSLLAFTASQTDGVLVFGDHAGGLLQVYLFLVKFCLTTQILIVLGNHIFQSVGLELAHVTLPWLLQLVGLLHQHSLPSTIRQIPPIRFTLQNRRLSVRLLLLLCVGHQMLIPTLDDVLLLLFMHSF